MPRPFAPEHSELNERTEIVADLRRHWPHQVEIRVAANLIESDAAEIERLRRRIADSELVTIEKMPGSAFGVFVLDSAWVGKRIRLVVEEEE
jgi:hypothetical protein